MSGIAVESVEWVVSRMMSNGSRMSGMGCGMSRMDIRMMWNEWNGL